MKTSTCLIKLNFIHIKFIQIKCCLVCGSWCSLWLGGDHMTCSSCLFDVCSARYSALSQHNSLLPAACPHLSRTTFSRERPSRSQHSTELILPGQKQSSQVNVVWEHEEVRRGDELLYQEITCFKLAQSYYEKHTVLFRGPAFTESFPNI